LRQAVFASPDWSWQALNWSGFDFLGF